MKTFIALPAAQLYAATLAQASKDVRYYLNGVHVNAERGDLVTTCGHTMFVKNFPDTASVKFITGEPLDGGCATIGGANGCNKGLKLPKPKKDDEVAIIGIDGKQAVIKFFTLEDVKYRGVEAAFTNSYAVATTGELIDGRFPDYTRVIPTSGVIGATDAVLNADYIMLAAKMAKALTGQKYTPLRINYAANDGSCTRIDLPYGCTFIIMPLKLDENFQVNPSPLCTLHTPRAAA